MFAIQLEGDVPAERVSDEDDRSGKVGLKRAMHLLRKSGQSIRNAPIGRQTVSRQIEENDTTIEGQ
ncbi:MAG TPA: hypothetical protein VGV89_11070 [Thermoplasmata archaeon]|nr:hypothetical protein [Thermoplasmata archaeon]